MQFSIRFAFLVAVVLSRPDLLFAEAVDESAIIRLDVQPEAIELTTPRRSVQVVVTAMLKSGEVADVTRDVGVSLRIRMSRWFPNLVTWPRCLMVKPL